MPFSTIAVLVQLGGNLPFFQENGEEKEKAGGDTVADHFGQCLLHLSAARPF